jgi:hypothetical protein
MKFGKPTRIRRIRTSSSSGAKKNRGGKKSGNPKRGSKDLEDQQLFADRQDHA